MKCLNSLHLGVGCRILLSSGTSLSQSSFVFRDPARRMGSSQSDQEFAPTLTGQLIYTTFTCADSHLLATFMTKRQTFKNHSRFRKGYKNTKTKDGIHGKIKRRHLIVLSRNGYSWVYSSLFSVILRLNKLSTCLVKCWENRTTPKYVWSMRFIYHKKL